MWRSAPDGYTLLVAPPPVVTVNNLLYRDMQYQPNQFVPITMLVQVPNVLIIRNGLPAKSVREFIVYAKSVPGKLNYGSQGLGSTAHLTARMFEWITGVQMTHIPYRGEALVLNDILAEHIDVFFGTLSTAMPFYRSKKLKFLAVGSPERNSIVPEVPTLANRACPAFAPPPGTLWWRLPGRLRHLSRESTVMWSRFSKMMRFATAYKRSCWSRSPVIRMTPQSS